MGKKSVFLTTALELVSKIDEQISEINAEINNIKAELKEVGRIASYAGIHLYVNHIVEASPIPLDSEIEAYVESGGQIWTETHISGGGARPTFTRAAAGALIAGKGNRRAGVLLGANVQKHRDITSSTTIHDDRTLRIIVNSDAGHIDMPGNPKDEDGARSFVSKILNTAIYYKNNKREVESELSVTKETLNDKIAALENSEELKMLQHNLDAHVQCASNTEFEELIKYQNQRGIWKIWMVFNMLCWIILGIIPLVFGLTWLLLLVSIPIGIAGISSCAAHIKKASIESEAINKIMVHVGKGQ
ncbi:MAG: hypothetical protein FWC73_11560 [Defluviitaleaceae bacterium]|nr:hypothetical protein [Defluviitaleaceae bacterium]